MAPSIFKPLEFLFRTGIPRATELTLGNGRFGTGAISVRPFLRWFCHDTERRAKINDDANEDEDANDDNDFNGDDNKKGDVQ